MMRRIIIIQLSLLFSFTLLNGQRNLPWDIWQNPNTKDFEEIKSQAEEWFQDKKKGRGSGYKQWKRWEEWNESRLNEFGEIVNNSSIKYQEYKTAIARQDRKKLEKRNTLGKWEHWSATEFTNAGSWAPGIGRINTIAYHPTDANTIFVGTPAGGLFKTTNNGNTWTSLTDDLASMGVSGIAIHPTNPDIIYILTGDGDGADTYSIGVYKSTNGGNSWSVTGLEWEVTDFVRGYKLMMEPGDPTYLLVASSNGIWQTKDSGGTWNMVLSGDYTDIEYKPGNSSRVYATSKTAFWYSTNYGTSWVPIFFPPVTTSRIQIATSPASPSTVYLFAGPYQTVGNADGFAGVFKSTDSGQSFTLMTNTPNILGGAEDGTGDGDQSTYDLAIAASPTNSATIITGGVNIWKSTDSGANMSLTSHWVITDLPTNVDYAHADIHHLSFNPLNNRLYAGTDGGIFYSNNNGSTWTDITSGLGISQIYHMDGTYQDKNFIVGGMQDNGTAIFSESSMTSELGADGGDCLIHPTNKNIFYAMTQTGNISRTLDGGSNFTSIDPDTSPMDTDPGPFITRMAMDKNNPDTIYAGWTNGDIFRSYNRGTNWTKISIDGSTDDIEFISVADNSSTVYACTNKKVYMSTNFGTTWVEIHSSNSLTSVTAFPGDNNKCIITRGNFGGGTKVWIYDAVEGLDPLNPILEPLPDVPVNIAAVSTKDPAIIYVGTDVGVFYYNFNGAFGDGWNMFNRGLPNVPVQDIQIYEDDGIMRIATFGRGIWESVLYDDCPYTITLSSSSDPFSGYPIYQLIEATDLIVSDRQILTGLAANVTYKAGDAVILQSGFLAAEGAKVLIGNKPCGIPLE